MKKQHYLIMLLLILTSFTSCEKDDFSYSNDFEKSYKAWTDFKLSSNDSYRYTVSTSSWTGTTTATVITVDKGKVVKRSYVAKSTISSSNEVIIHEQWEEQGATLHTHPNGSALKTLDEVYQKAKAEWLPKRGNAKSYFETKNDGMISSCGYVENNCADDCFVGITITTIAKL
jgi:hypothetical protein